MGAWQRVAGQERWRQQAYVRQIVVNTCRSGWRKWGARVSVGDMPELVQQPGTDAVDDRELVRQALDRLPPDSVKSCCCVITKTSPRPR